MSINSKLIERLKKLNELREKSIISNELYEQEAKEILQKIHSLESDDSNTEKDQTTTKDAKQEQQSQYRDETTEPNYYVPSTNNSKSGWIISIVLLIITGVLIYWFAICGASNNPDENSQADTTQQTSTNAQSETQSTQTEKSKNQENVQEQKEPSEYEGSVYVLSSDEYIPIKYTRTYSGAGSEFITKYTIYHPTKGYAWITVTATHNKTDKTIKISIDDINGGVFSHINDEESSYETPSLEPFGFRGDVAALAGNRVPNQLMIKFASAQYENIKVINVLGSDKSGDFNNTMYFVLDEKN